MYFDLIASLARMILFLIPILCFPPFAKLAVIGVLGGEACVGIGRLDPGGWLPFPDRRGDECWAGVATDEGSATIRL